MKDTKTADRPLVSVIMPVYNYEKYIEAAMDSIINQTYQNLEIIVVDDCSTDNTLSLVKKFAAKDRRIVVIHNKQNLRLTKTLNVGVKNSRGKYLARMDGDDIRTLSGIEKEVEFLEDHPEVVMVGGAAEVCDQDMNSLNERHYPLTDLQIKQKIFRYSPFCHASIVMRSGILGREPYKVDWAEDYDLYFRLGREGKLANLDEVVYRIRTHRNSISQAKQRFQEKATLRTRIKAAREYGYKMSFSDKVYFMAQAGSMYLMPMRFRFWLFNKMRSSN